MQYMSKPMYFPTVVLIEMFFFILNNYPWISLDLEATYFHSNP